MLLRVYMQDVAEIQDRLARLASSATLDFWVNRQEARPKNRERLIRLLPTFKTLSVVNYPGGKSASLKHFRRHPFYNQVLVFDVRSNALLSGHHPSILDFLWETERKTRVESQADARMAEIIGHFCDYPLIGKYFPSIGSGHCITSDSMQHGLVRMVEEAEQVVRDLKRVFSANEIQSRFGWFHDYGLVAQILRRTSLGTLLGELGLESEVYWQYDGRRLI